MLFFYYFYLPVYFRRFFGIQIVTNRLTKRYTFMEKFLLILFTFFTFGILAQGNENALRKTEEKLNTLLNELRSVKTNDGRLFELNNKFKKEFKKALEIDGAFEYPFSSLRSVGKIYSQDQLVRIITWNTQQEDFSHNYYSFILKKDERRGKVTVIELEREKQNLYGIQYDPIGPNNWYGALYYDVVDVKKRNKTYYTLLGYDANNQRSAIKLIDVLHFVGNKPTFGAPIFDSNKNRATRIIFEHSAESTMSLKFDKQRNKIIFDHLSPESPTMKEFREYYVPDMSYDAYEWDGNNWTLKEDIIAINKDTPEKIQLKAYDAELDSVVNVPVKNKWENPSDASAPIDGGKHRAMMPDDLDQNNTKGKKEKKQKKAKKNNAKSTSKSAILPSKKIKTKRKRK